MKTERATSFPRPLCLAVLVSTIFAANTLAQSASTNFWKKLPQGPQVHSYYEGRSPCREIARMLGVAERDECIKIKWQLILFQDPVTKSPTIYAFGGFQWRNPPKTGKWAIVRGTREDPNAVVFQLDPDQPQGTFSFQKADENILLFLDKDRRLLVGNSRFSYTLNRINKP